MSLIQLKTLILHLPNIPHEEAGSVKCWAAKSGLWTRESVLEICGFSDGEERGLCLHCTRHGRETEHAQSDPCPLLATVDDSQVLDVS